MNFDIFLIIVRNCQIYKLFNSDFIFTNDLSRSNLDLAKRMRKSEFLLKLPSCLSKPFVHSDSLAFIIISIRQSYELSVGRLQSIEYDTKFPLCRLVHAKSTTIQVEPFRASRKNMQTTMTNSREFFPQIVVKQPYNTGMARLKYFNMVQYKKYYRIVTVCPYFVSMTVDSAW